VSFDFITIVTTVVVPTLFCLLLRYNLLQNHGSTSCFDTHEHLAVGIGLLFCVQCYWIKLIPINQFKELEIRFKSTCFYP
jgi:hypothetical protein